MLLDELLQIDRSDIAHVAQVAHVDVTGLSADSRAVAQGDLFIAYAGETHDGHDFIGDAVAHGASAVCCERPPAAPLSVPTVVDPAIASRQSEIADRFFGSPSAGLNCVGVTGTNGKTSIAYFCASILDDAAFIGTIGWGDPEDLCPASLTTADPISMQRRLAVVRDRGMSSVAMETSSHALDQGRVSAVDFDVAVFSNLTRDHLDYHGTMERYGAAKRSLFERADLQTAVINVDDEFGRDLIGRVARDGLQCISYGASNADVTWTNVVHGPDGMTGIWNSPWGQSDFELPLYGDFSLANAAAALSCVVALDVGFEDAVDRMRRLPPVPGRMQIVRQHGAPVVIVDYAHTPDALAAVLQATRAHLSGRLHCVFGCGGDRDAGKRPLMATAVEAHADRAVVTSDNPRNEDPLEIIAQVVGGFGSVAYTVEPDRSAAIVAAIDQAETADVVVVAGKGHETYQEIAGVRHPFNDLEVVRRALKERA